MYVQSICNFLRMISCMKGFWIDLFYAFTIQIRERLERLISLSIIHRKNNEKWRCIVTKEYTMLTDKGFTVYR